MQRHKTPRSFKVLLRTENFYNSIKLYRMGFSFWVIEVILLFSDIQIIPNDSRASGKEEPLSLLACAS